MKKAILITFLLSIVLIAEPLKSGTPQTQAGSKAILFGINGLSDLSLQNSRVAFQYLFADKMGLWAGLGLAFLSDKPNEDASDNVNNDLDLDIGFLYYLFQKGPVACWVSPKIGIGFGSSEYQDIETPKVEISSNAFDIGLQVGVEWWFTDNVSLSLETDFGFVSKKKTIESASHKIESSQTKFGILSDGSASFVILFYF